MMAGHAPPNVSATVVEEIGHLPVMVRLRIPARTEEALFDQVNRAEIEAWLSINVPRSTRI
jgi:hypothetical protein